MWKMMTKVVYYVVLDVLYSIGELHLNFVDQLDPLRQSKMSVDHLKSGGVQTESMQTPDGLWVDDHEIHSFGCMVGGVQPECVGECKVHDIKKKIWQLDAQYSSGCVILSK